MDALFAEKSDIEGLLAGLARETRVLVHLTDSEGRGTATAHQRELREGLGDVADTGEGGARPPSQLTRCVRAGQGFATKIQTALGKMKAENARVRERHGEDDRLYVVRRMHYDRLVQEFMESMRQHQEAKASLSQGSKQALMRRARLVLPGESSEALARRIDEDPEGFVARELLGHAPSDVVLQAYSEVQARAREVRELAASVQEVHDMFRDLHFLLTMDHEEVVQSEDKVVEAATRVHKADTQLEKAVVKQESRCCIQ